MLAAKNLNKIVLPLFSAAFFYLAFSVNQHFSRPPMVISKQEASWNLDTQMLKRFNLGYKRLGSSLMWVSTILESDTEHYKKKDLNSWMFLRFYTISNLEPLFYENYAFGGLYLSIIKDDISGASILYDKGLHYYGNDFALLRDAGFHYYFEAEDYTRAYKIYSRIKNHPEVTPVILSSLARLEKSQGNTDEAYNLLLSKYNQIVDKESYLAKKLYTHLYSLRAESDLECLNSAPSKDSCPKKDFNGNRYLKINGRYQAVEKWEPFKIRKKFESR